MKFVQSFEIIMLRIIIVISINIIGLFVFNAVVNATPTQVNCLNTKYAKCANAGDKSLLNGSQYYCCPKRTFKPGVTYEGIGSTQGQYTMQDSASQQTVDAVGLYGGTWGVPEDDYCYYRVQNMCYGTGSVCAPPDVFTGEVYSDDNVLPTAAKCDSAAFIASKPCGNKCMKTGVSGFPDTAFCYAINEEDFTTGQKCGCTNGDWSTLGFHSAASITSCTQGTPPAGGGSGTDANGDGIVDDQEKEIKVDPLTQDEINKACNNACSGLTQACPCASCIAKPGNVWTEVGCIQGTAYGTTLAVMRIAIGIISGLVLLRFIQAGLLYGSGDPEKIKEASSIAISAAAALIFLGLCIVLINFAGVNVLGFGKEIKIITG